jgi:hypothetical protein
MLRSRSDTASSIHVQVLRVQARPVELSAPRLDQPGDPLCTHHMINAWRSSTPSCETLTSSPFAVTAVFSPSDTLIAGGPGL